MSDETKPKGRRFIFNVYFHYNKGNKVKEEAIRKREEYLIYLHKTFQTRARFSVIARDWNKQNSCFLLRGAVNFKNVVQMKTLKNILGKYSNCKFNTFGDIVSLMKYHAIDRDCVCSGRLPSSGNNKHCKMRSYATDAAWIVKTLNDELARREDDEM